jgi:hypothetical protein
LTPIESPDKDNVQPPAELIDDAMKSRPDLAVARLQIENSKLSLKGSRNQLLPQVNAVASMENNGLVGMLNPLSKRERCRAKSAWRLRPPVLRVRNRRGICICNAWFKAGYFGQRRENIFTVEGPCPA